MGISEQIQKDLLVKETMRVELTRLGVARDAIDLLDETQLSELLSGLGRLLAYQKNKAGSKPLTLSPIDKKILGMLVSSDKEVSYASLARGLNIPLTTVQRRLTRLEELLDYTYSLKTDRFGIRSITFFISTERRIVEDVGRDILKMKGVTTVARAFNGNVDLRVDVLLRGNSELVIIEEQIRKVNGVKELFWIESVAMIGRNNTTLLSIIDTT